MTTSTSSPSPEIRGPAWLLTELRADRGWYAEHPSARKIGEVTAGMALIEVEQGHTTIERLDDDKGTEVRVDPPSVFIGNAVNVSMVARAVAGELGEDQQLAGAVAVEVFTEGLARLQSPPQ